MMNQSLSLGRTTNNPKTKSGGKNNEFHKIRDRELRRERECLKGAPTTAIPAYFTPSLKEICAKTIADNFAKQDRVDALKDDPDTYELYRLVLDQLPTKLAMDEVVRRVSEQDYWRACCEANWSAGALTEFTKSGKLEPPASGGWKQVYLERQLEEWLMGLECLPPVEEGKEDVAGDAINSKMVKMCTTCGNWIRCLRLTHQGYHFNVELLASKLPGLEEFYLTYGVLNANVKFRMDMLKMKQHDAMWIQSTLRSATSLHSLSLPGNGIDNDLLRALVAGLVNNTKVTYLDLTSNRISDDGVKALGTLLSKKDYVLETLLLGDNQITAAGAEHLGKALTVNTHLKTLNLKLNRLGYLKTQDQEDGGLARGIGMHNNNRPTTFGIANGLRMNQCLTHLNLCSNDLTAEVCGFLGDALKNNTTILNLDLAGNPLSEEGGRLLLSAVEGNNSLIEIDIRACKVDPRDEEAITKAIQKRVAQQQNDRLDIVEANSRVRINKSVNERLMKTHGVSSVAPLY